MHKEYSTNSRQSALRQFDTILVEGIHFNHQENYFIQLLNKFCLISWFTPYPQLSSFRTKTLNSSKESDISLIECFFNKTDLPKVFIWQRRLFTSTKIEYIFGNSEQEVKERAAAKEISIQVCLKM